MVRILTIALAAAGLWCVVAWVAARALIVDAPLARADALVILSGAPVYRERLLHGAELFAAGHSAKVVLTNDGGRGSWSRTLQRNPLMSERGLLQLGQAGVPATSIDVISDRVRSTYDEAVAVRQYAIEHNLKSVLVVTSQYHSRRALWTFRRVLGDAHIAVGISPAPPAPGTPTTGNWWWQFQGWDMVAGEYVKLAYYRFQYS
jgi:uncharacterized SAM-binding protein YcdF (DUF218 family)